MIFRKVSIHEVQLTQVGEILVHRKSLRLSQQFGDTHSDSRVGRDTVPS